MITTDTHTINAYYLLNDYFDTYEITTNGHTIDEIVADMLEFVNGMDEKATTFEVTENDFANDNFRVIIKGRVYLTSEDGDLTKETDTMTIIIEGWEK